MRLHIRHNIDFAYDRPVFLEPMTVRLRPRSDCVQRLLDYRLDVTPAPAGQSQIVDAHGNVATVLWFDDLKTKLSLASHCVVDTLLANPFNYLITEPAALSLPPRYPPLEYRALWPCLQRDQPHPAVDALTGQVIDAADHHTQEFLRLLAEKLNEDCRIVVRDDGDAFAPHETLERERVACRDVAALYIDACRAAGIAARFVSGYKLEDAPEVDEPHELHAWVQAYLPGAGWRGYDPTLGLVVADRHVTLAAAAHPAAAAPTTGSFRGNEATSTMSFDIDIRSDEHITE